ncbi:MAG TPA: triphosphoribosyl-dephospho-CoA synthase, partial [Methylophaga sp.]|nr:triphosphoribosyl-dephospho-CoA synthase [Methylophaga sp.]
MLAEQQIADSVRWACEQEVNAPKPGNVNVWSDGHNMAVQDFLSSAAAIAPVMAQPNLKVGERILQSIKATRKVVDCNTNLGIVLLFAPLCDAIQRCSSFDQLSSELEKTL